MQEVQAAIKSLESVSAALEKVSNRPDLYNSDYAYHLEQMSWSMHKQAQELRSLECMWG